jgi:anti-sigma factor (TIGR02949 family)
MTLSKKDKLNCADIEKFVQQYLDGLLSEEDNKLFEEHLDYCLPCDKKIEFEKKLKDVVKLKLKRVVPQVQIEERIGKLLSDLY